MELNIQKEYYVELTTHVMNHFFFHEHVCHCYKFNVRQ